LHQTHVVGQESPTCRRGRQLEERGAHAMRECYDTLALVWQRGGVLH